MMHVSDVCVIAKQLVVAVAAILLHGQAGWQLQCSVPHSTLQQMHTGT